MWEISTGISSTTRLKLRQSSMSGAYVPPFFETLSNYIDLKNQQFNCPGHQSGQYFRKHPAGRYLYDFYGEMIFRSDICNADVALGDLLIHEGPAEDALKNAAKVFNSDNTFFVMNGTSTSNIIVATALVAPGRPGTFRPQ